MVERKIQPSKEGKCGGGEDLDRHAAIDEREKHLDMARCDRPDVLQVSRDGGNRISKSQCSARNLSNQLSYCTVGRVSTLAAQVRDHGAGRYYEFTARAHTCVSTAAHALPRGKREISEETRRPVPLCSMIPVCENPGIEPGSPWCKASSLTTRPPLSRFATEKTSRQRRNDVPVPNLLSDCPCMIGCASHAAQDSLPAGKTLVGRHVAGQCVAVHLPLREGVDDKHHCLSLAKVDNNRGNLAHRPRTSCSSYNNTSCVSSTFGNLAHRPRTSCSSYNNTSCVSSTFGNLAHRPRTSCSTYNNTSCVSSTFGNLAHRPRTSCSSYNNTSCVSSTFGNLAHRPRTSCSSYNNTSCVSSTFGNLAHRPRTSCSSYNNTSCVSSTFGNLAHRPRTSCSTYNNTSCVSSTFGNLAHRPRTSCSSYNNTSCVSSTFTCQLLPSRLSFRDILHLIVGRKAGPDISCKPSLRNKQQEQRVYWRSPTESYLLACTARQITYVTAHVMARGDHVNEPLMRRIATPTDIGGEGVMRGRARVSFQAISTRGAAWEHRGCVDSGGYVISRTTFAAPAWGRSALLPTCHPLAVHNYTSSRTQTSSVTTHRRAIHPVPVWLPQVLQSEVSKIRLDKLEPRWLSGKSARLPPRRSGFNPRPGHSGFSHVEIVPDDAVGKRVFSGISRLPAISFRHCSYAQQSPLSALNTSVLRAVQISRNRSLIGCARLCLVSGCCERILLADGWLVWCSAVFLGSD
ncbi:hypothetical protein PR048_003905 [Dryococelus australis]|uniref:Uncharacterized protein n=1 Tax=Dryococelus australis TaxID=614101 RepID=A0ABQ9IPG6_9NEOP|nr:hypothetical protein PR048_003905 [Dryococelus australis]